MKFYQEFGLMACLVIGALHEVQGKMMERALGNAENVKENERHSFDSLKPAEFKESTYKHAENFRISTVPDARQKVYLGRNHLRTSKYDAAQSPHLTKRSYSTTRDKETLYSRNALPVHSQRVYCRQVTTSERNSQGDSVNTIQHICVPIASAVYSRDQSAALTPPPVARNVTRNISFGGTVSAAPKGINCRRVMNSELNDLGEIVDSVTELCDPPSTTTTTTVRPTTRKVTTTTPKPLVKVCRPVMDSYLNEEGRIMDSVTTVCKMEPTN